jgi:hypothetical protein
MSKNSYLKLALCLSGQPRSYFDGYSYIKKNLLDHYDVDVFVHSWKNTNHLEQLRIYEEVKAIYSPIFSMFDSTLSDKVNSDMFVPNASHPAHFCTSMFYSIFKADQFRILSELFYEKKYDFVIRCRFDFALNKVVDFSKLEKHKVYISKDTDGPNPLLNDQFAIADPETMKIYSSTFQFLRYHHNRTVPLCGHSMLEAQLDLFKVAVERIDIDHPFVDGKFNIGRHSIIRNDMSKWVDTKIWGY